MNSFGVYTRINKILFLFSMISIQLGDRHINQKIMNILRIMCKSVSNPIFLTKVAISHFTVLLFDYSRLFFNLLKIGRTDMSKQLFCFCVLVNQRLYFLSFSRMCLKAALVKCFICKAGVNISGYN